MAGGTCGVIWVQRAPRPGALVVPWAGEPNFAGRKLGSRKLGSLRAKLGAGRLAGSELEASVPRGTGDDNWVPWVRRWCGVVWRGVARPNFFQKKVGLRKVGPPQN